MAMLWYVLAIPITALAVVAMGITAIAAPYTLKSRQRYDACAAKWPDRHSCERYRATRECFTNYNQCKAVCRIDCKR